MIGLANTLVHVEDRFTGLADQLLGRTIVVRTIDDGITIARKYRQSLRLVTLEGELINPGGSMTGGAFKNSSNLLSRRREIEEFEKTVALLKADMDAMEKQVSEIKTARASCYNTVDEIQKELRKASVLENTEKMNVEQTRVRQREAQERFERFREEQSNLERQLLTIAENEESIQMELETSQSLEQELNAEIEMLQKNLENEKEEESTRLKESEKVHLALAGFEQQNAFIEENIARINEEIEKFEAELKELDRNKDCASEEIREKEAKISELRQTIDDSKDLYSEIEKEIGEQSSKREELNRKHKDFLKMREELSKHISALDKECFRLNSQKESYEASSEKQINYMWEEYEITYNHAMELRNPNLTDLSLMKRQIQTLKNEIRQLGTVNVNAIEDYKNVSERYEFLKGQHDDLVEAEATLVQIIDELDSAMRKQFSEQFKRIADEFNIVFRELFGGGKGTLELMEDEDILEAGICIIAQPPGKKLQNMMQLSGGEKALTAISLLFAIQNLKPSPFCLLDEIEAALDDNNVTRFARYLHKLTKYTQFIVITHRRGTMSAADRLYGITMQEKGVSTLVSVDLLENELVNRYTYSNKMEEKKGFFKRLVSGLTKTRDNIVSGMDSIFHGFSKIDDDFYEELEETLIMGDLGVRATMNILDDLKEKVREQHIKEPIECRQLLIDSIREQMDVGETAYEFEDRTSVVFVIGVNGVGKTTTIGKLAGKLKNQGKRVVIAAADTFRAAAGEQLKEWANRASVDMIGGQEGADPAAVIYDAVAAAKARKADVLLCDTAGRLHNKKNLMEELKKINRVIDREYPEAFRETLVVLDATTGQNALAQAKEFNEVTDITGVVLTKMDGTAKGGIAVAIQAELGIPVKYIGVGETIDDLQKFDSGEFVNALFYREEE